MSIKLIKKRVQISLQDSPIKFKKPGGEVWKVLKTEFVPEPAHKSKRLVLASVIVQSPTGAMSSLELASTDWVPMKDSQEISMHEAAKILTEESKKFVHTHEKGLVWVGAYTWGPAGTVFVQKRASLADKEFDPSLKLEEQPLTTFVIECVHIEPTVNANELEWKLRSLLLAKEAELISDLPDAPPLFKDKEVLPGARYQTIDIDDLPSLVERENLFFVFGGRYPASQPKLLETAIMTLEENVPRASIRARIRKEYRLL